MKSQTPVECSRCNCGSNTRENCVLKQIFNKIEDDDLVARQCDIIRMMFDEFINSKSFKKMKKKDRSNIVHDLTNIIQFNEELNSVSIKRKKIVKHCKSEQ